MTKTKIGLILYTLRDYMKTPDDTARTLERVKKIGYDAVELAGLGGLTGSEMAKRLKENELAAVSAHIGWGNLTGDKKQLADSHLEFGCNHVVISSMPGEFRSYEGYQQFAKQASAAAAELAEYGVTFGYHNHSFEFTHYDGKAGQQIMLDNCDRNHFNFEIDTYWIQHGGGSPAEWIRKCKGCAPTVHMKDMIMRDGDQTFAPVGEGNLNWREIIQACKEAETKYHIVEQDTCHRDAFDCVASSLKFMQSMGLK